MSSLLRASPTACHTRLRRRARPLSAKGEIRFGVWRRCAAAACRASFRSAERSPCSHASPRRLERPLPLATVDRAMRPPGSRMLPLHPREAGIDVATHPRGMGRPYPATHSPGMTSCRAMTCPRVDCVPRFVVRGRGVTRSRHSGSGLRPSELHPRDAGLHFAPRMASIQRCCRCYCRTVRKALPRRQAPKAQ